MENRDKIIEDLRAMIAIQFPLFMEFLVSTPFVIDSNVKTLSTDGKNVKINPDFFFGKNQTAQFTYVMHEIGHIFLGHHLRLHEEWDNNKQQEAADYAVNDFLRSGGLQLTQGMLFERRYSGMAFEDIYALLEARQQQSNHDPDNHGEVEQSPDSEEEKDDSGDTLDSGKKEEKREQAIQEHGQKVQRAIQSAKLMGALSNDMQVKLDAMFKPEINWRDVFCLDLQQATDFDEYTYRKPNKKSDEFILPTMYSERGPVIAFAGDTSSSVSLEAIKKMASEIVGLIETVSPEELHVIWCDYSVKKVQKFVEGDVIELTPKGRGGTNFKPPFEYLEQEDITPDVFVYMTDGFCSSFPEPPDYPVIWMIWQDFRDFKPPFGTVINFK